MVSTLSVIIASTSPEYFNAVSASVTVPKKILRPSSLDLERYPRAFSPRASSPSTGGLRE